MKLLSIILISIFSLNFCMKEKGKPPKAENGVLDLSNWNFTKDGIVNLEGEWEFYWKVFIEPNNLESESKNSLRPNYIKVPGKWNNFKINGNPIGARGYGSYHLMIILPNHENQLNELYKTPLAIKIPTINTAYEVWIQENLVAKGGKIGSSENDSIPDYVTNLVFLDNVSIRKNLANQYYISILIKVSNFHHRHGGVWRIELGSISQMLHSEYLNIIFEFFLFGSILIIGLYHFGLYSYRKKDKSTFWLGVFCLLICYRIVANGEHFLYKLFPDNWKLFTFLDYIEFTSILYSFGLFLVNLFPNEFNNKFFKSLIWISIFNLIPTIILPSFYYTHLVAFTQLIFLIGGTSTIYFLILAIRNKTLGGKFFLFAYIFLFLFSFHDVLLYQRIIYSIPLSYLGIFIFIFSQAYVLSIRLSTAFNQVEELSLKMEIQNDKLEEQNKNLKKIDKLKDELLSNLSHEIRTPLSVVYGYSELLLNLEDLEKVKKFSQNIHENAQLLNDFINEVIFVSDLESGLILNKTNCSLKDIITNCINNYKHLIKEKDLNIIISKDINLIIHGDFFLISKAFLAIIKNAIVFNKQGGSIEINAEKDKDPSHILISIKDSGIGIKEEYFVNIFDKFFRVDSSLTYEVGGIGLGLFIANKIINLHNGKIKVFSEINKGSNFIINI